MVMSFCFFSLAFLSSSGHIKRFNFLSIGDVGLNTRYSRAQQAAAGREQRSGGGSMAWTRRREWVAEARGQAAEWATPSIAIALLIDPIALWEAVQGTMENARGGGAVDRPDRGRLGLARARHRGGGRRGASALS